MQRQNSGRRGYEAIVNPAELTKVIGHEFEYGEIMNLDLSILACATH